MRLRVASDRVFRTVAKAVGASAASPAARPRRSDPSPRGLAATVRDVLLLLASVLFFLQSARSAWGFGSFDPQSASQWRLPGERPLAAVTACADLVRLRAMHAPLRAASIPLIAAIPASKSASAPAGATLLAGVWAPAQAVNLAAARASADWLLLLPCGCLPGGVPSRPSAGAYYASAGASARGDVCGLTTLVQKAAFFGVRGLDERVSGAWDPSLRARLASAGVRPDVLPPPRAPAGAYRAKEHVGLVEDALMQRGAPAWDAKTPATPAEDADEFEKAKAERRRRRAERAKIAASYRVLRSGAHAPFRRALPLDALHAPGARGRARLLAAREAVRGRYGLPRAVSVGMNGETLARLHASLERLEADGTHPTFVVGHVQHGLGNRLRALGSSLAYARATNRVPVIVWERDAHCEARFESLFLPQQAFVSSLGPRNLADAARADDAWSGWKLFDYMAPGAKDLPVSAPVDRSVYFRSAYALRAEPRALATWSVANAAVRALKPAKAVEALAPAEAGDMIGVHVRARPVEGEVAGASYDANSTRLLAYWRRKSAPAVFAEKMEAIRKQNPKARFLVAADSDKAREELRKVAGATVLNGCEGRGEHCVQHAFAEMRALAGTYHVLGSPWSSFSEAVVRLGKMHMEVAGVDFGVDDVESVRERVGDDVADVLKEVLKRREAKLKRRKAKKIHF